GEVQRRRDGVADQLGAAEGNGEGVPGDESAEDRQEGERPEPAGSAGVEITQGDAGGAVLLGDQQARDQGPRGDGAGVGADVASGQGVEAGMEPDDQQDRDGPQAVDVGPVPEPDGGSPSHRRRPNLADRGEPMPGAAGLTWPVATGRPAAGGCA